VCSARSDFQYHYTGAGSGRVAKHLTKVSVQCDERSSFAPTDFKQYLVRGPAQSLARNCNSIMTGGADKIGGAAAQIFIEL